MPTRAQLLEIIRFQAELARQGLDLGEVMALVVERVVDLTHADGAAIELAEADEMVYRATSGIARGYLGLRLRQEDSLSGHCVRTGESAYCSDVEHDPRVNLEACRSIGLRSMFVAPLMYHDRIVGILKAMSVRRDGLTPRDRTILSLLSDLIGASIHFALEFGGQDLFYRATHDGLTGLANRSLFMDRLRNVLNRCQRDNRHAGIAMIDMNGLKQVNDTHGHRAGDAVIREFATRIRQVARSSDTVARLGGDEFSMILTPIDVPVGPHAVIERLERKTAAPFVFEGHEFSLRASVGIAVFPQDGDALDALIECADHRMYVAKDAFYGRQRC